MKYCKWILSFYCFACGILCANHAYGGDTVNLNPSVKELKAVSGGQAVLRLREDNHDTIENGILRVTLDSNKSLQLKELYHKAAGVNIIANSEGEMFVFDIDGVRLSSLDFQIQRADEIEGSFAQKEIVYELFDQNSGIKAFVNIRLGESQELYVALSLKNAGKSQKFIKVSFPFISGIRWKGDGQDDYYMFPFCTGIISNKNARIISGYGIMNVYLQQMVSYSPALGGGMYLRVNDPRGEIKMLHFYKGDESGEGFKYGFNDMVADIDEGRLESPYVFQMPFRSTNATNMAFSYQARYLDAGEQWILPAAVIGFVNGDWRPAMEAYRKWYEQVTYTKPYPNKLFDRFSWDGIGFAHQGHDANGYTTDMTKWGHIPVFAPERSQFLKNPMDLVEHTSYWEWDVVTPEYLAKYQKVAKEQAGKESVTSPDRIAVMNGDKYLFLDKGTPGLEGTTYFWGNQGHYGLQGYNERWGGLPAFRRHLDNIREKGYLCTLYVNNSEAALSSAIAQKYGADWAVLGHKGYIWGMDAMWCMCLDIPGWRQYLADTCQRLITETRADGIRIDVMGGCQKICYNKKHEHTFARPHHQADMQAQLETVREVKMAMIQADPQAILMTETPGMDLMWQYVDGTLSYDLSDWKPLVTTFGNTEGFVGINIWRFYFPRIKFADYQVESKYPQWKFFNATASFNREWCFTDLELNILKSNADAFGSLYPEPMLKTLADMVYVNKFLAENKIIYTIYNASSKDFSGNLLEVEAKPGWHFVDLYKHRKLQTTTKGAVTLVGMDVKARQAGCIAYLPSVMKVHKDGKIKLAKSIGETGLHVQAVDQAGQTILRRDIGNTKIVDLPQDIMNKNCIIQLLGDKYMLDAITLDIK